MNAVELNLPTIPSPPLSGDARPAGGRFPVRAPFWWVALLIGIAFSVGVQAHEDKNTHATLTVGALLFLDQAFPEDGLLFNEEARGNVRAGSIDEDECPNYISHFFNPKTGENTMPNISLPYCLFPDGWQKQTAPNRASDFWQLAVTEYASNKSAAFLHLGHAMHLLQDMTSPAHVHNDVHADGAGNCNSDGDDFERWGWCIQPANGNQPAFNFTNIYRFVRYRTVVDSEILPPLAIGLQKIFANKPQAAAAVSGKNSGYAFVSRLADKVYDFTTFQVTLTDTLDPNDPGGGELKRMFPSLEETTVPAAWWINDIGYSQGQCTGLASTFQQAWWMMSCTTEGYCGPWYAPKSVYCVSGYAYLENIGGGTGLQQEVPNTLVPAEYNRDWFKLRYNGTKNNSSRTPMLDIYGDILYPAAVSFGAGMIQKFLDEAIMSKPLTDDATQLTGISAQLNGHVMPVGENVTVWFDWGTSDAFGNTASVPDAGMGATATNVSARLEGLTADTLYHFRIGASNRFGIRLGRRLTFRTPALLVTGNVPNAWQITDRSPSSTLNYTTNLNPTLQEAARSNGWHFSITGRFTDDFGGSKAIAFLYQSTASRRFLVWWDKDAQGNLTAEIEGQNVRIIGTNGLGASAYHLHELRCTNNTATYWVDGTAIGTWNGAAVANNPAGQVFWGSGSSAGMGQMNFRDVVFEIQGTGVVAAYHAGTSPASALSPVMQGWTANPPMPAPPLAVTSISPDIEGYVALVETMPPSDVHPTNARLNGRVNPQGQPTASWFEWGLSTGYGNRTPVRTLGSSFAWLDEHADLNGLIAEQAYHFRLVASNDFTVAFGSDQVLRTGGFVATSPLATAVDIGSLAWGDFDNDGDLDLLVAGQTDSTSICRIYRQNGDGTFTDANAGLPDVNWGQAAWGDFNNDGRLDIVLSGLSASGPVCRIYRNNGNGTFTDVNAGLPAVAFSAVAWFDCDNDGDLDLLITGQDASTNRIAAIYRNDHGTNFVDFDAGLAGSSSGAVVAGDFDGDNDLDLIITGVDNFGLRTTSYYRNDGPDGFSRLDLGLPGAEWSCLAAGDYDNDGDLDLLLSGYTGDQFVTQLYKNVRSGNVLEFEPVAAPFPGLSSGTAAWGDYDNDGDLDLVLGGWIGMPFADVYRNDGDDTFTPMHGGLTGVFWCSAIWGDFDNDGDLDLALSGRDDMGGPNMRSLRVYRNESPIINSPPGAPSDLTGGGTEGSATVRWEAPLDAQTPASGLSYNLVLSTTPGGRDLADPMANLTNGFRRVVQPGGAGQNNFWTFTGLTNGTYHFSVQAIDSALSGGPFAEWKSIEVTAIKPGIIEATIPQAGQFHLRFIGGPGGAYTVLGSSNLTHWDPLGPGVETAPGQFEFLDVSTSPGTRFYEIRSDAP